MIKTLPEPFDHLLFVPRIADVLSTMISKQKFPGKYQVVVLYGYPGTGKTSFAKLFAQTFAEEVDYHAMNEHTKDVDSRSFKDKLLMNRKTISLFKDDSKKFECITILDEFHNISSKQQDTFKVMFENLRENDLVFVCLNITKGRSLDKQLSEPLKSRAHCMKFNVERREKTSHIRDLSELYPLLKVAELSSWLPDMRRIENENEIRLEQEKGEQHG